MNLHYKHDTVPAEYRHMAGQLLAQLMAEPYRRRRAGFDAWHLYQCDQQMRQAYGVPLLPRMVRWCRIAAARGLLPGSTVAMIAGTLKLTRLEVRP